jgi:glycosyltransferase involved in cell wall biosynthesis
MSGYSNKYWENNRIPHVTVITTVYNRRDVLLRAMRSVDNQTFNDIEYIVVDNGSTINIDDIVCPFLNSASIPMLYLKNQNGLGPHSGKRLAIEHARGEYIVMLDSDDELLPKCIEVLYSAWQSIPKESRHLYREVVALCEDEYGHQIGDCFPASLNKCTPNKASKIWHERNLSVEHVNMSVTKLLQDPKFIFPEPEGVTWVVDSTFLWDRLSVMYKSYFINDRLKRYYTQSEDSISNTQIKKITIQHCINLLWAYKFTIDHINEYSYGIIGRLKRTMLYCVFYNILKQKKSYPKFKWASSPITQLSNRFLISVLWIPSMVIASIYINKKM